MTVKSVVFGLSIEPRDSVACSEISGAKDFFSGDEVVAPGESPIATSIASMSVS